MQTMLNAIKASDTLMSEGSISEYLPHYAEMTYSFDAGLAVRIADHGNGLFQATFSGFYSLEPATPEALVQYLTNLD